MTSFVLVAGFAAYLALLGGAWLALIPNAPRGLGWRFGAGGFLWAYSLFLWNAAGGRWSRAGLLAWAAAAALLPRLFRRASPSPSRGAAFRPAPAEALCLALLGLSLAAVLLQTFALPLYHWDGLTFYAHKGQILFHEGTFRVPAFQDPGVVHPFTDYPLLLPYLESTYYALLGWVDDRLVKILLLSYWLAWLAVVFGGLAERLERGPAAALTAALGSLPLFCADAGSNAVSGYVDAAFALYWTAGVLLLAREKPGPAALFLAGAVFTKANGLALAPAGILLAAARAPRKERGRILACAAGLLVLLLPWLRVRHGLPHNSDYAPRLAAIDWSAAAARVPVVAGAWLRELAEPSRWGIFWPAVILAAALGRARAAGLLLGAAGLQWTIYFAVYLVSPVELIGLLKNSLDRELLHAAGLMTVAAGWALAPARKT